MSYTYRKILPSETIGDSLFSINSNYSNLAFETINLQLSSEMIWSPMQQYYLQFGSYIKDAINTINSVATSIFNATTIVQNNSAAWIKPITIFYPEIFPSTYSQNTIVNTLSSFLQNYYPIIPEPTYIIDPNTGEITDTILPTQPSYVQNQTLIIYAHTWNMISNYNITNTLFDSTNCQTYDQRVCGTCTVCYYGGTWCGTDTWATCGGLCTSCSTCENLKCSYDNPYKIINKNNQNASSNITATISFQYQDIGEAQNINTFVFSVQGCNWIFNNNPTTK